MFLVGLGIALSGYMLGRISIFKKLSDPASSIEILQILHSDYVFKMYKKEYNDEE